MSNIHVRWSKRERALLYTAESSTGGMLAHFLEGIKWPDNRTLAQELEARGYDLTTLTFRVRRKEIP